MDNQKKAYRYAIATVLVWSTVASAFKISLRFLDFVQLLFFSTLTSTIVLFILLAFQHKLLVFRKFSKKDFFLSLLLGFLNPFLYYSVLLKAYSLLPAQQAQTLNYTWPIVLPLLSVVLLKQKIGLKSILAIVLSFVGVIIVATQGSILKFHFTNPLGVGLALGSTVIWSFYWIFNIKDKQDAVARLFLNFLFGLCYTFIALAVFSKITIPPPKGMAGAAYVGLFEMGITFVLWLSALKLSKTTAQVSNLIYLSPFLSLILIRLVVGERILVSTAFGLVLIVAGIIIQQYTKRGVYNE